MFNLSGSYLLPWWDFAIAAKYNARDGDPLNRTNVFSFTNPTLTQPSATVRVPPAAPIAPIPSTSSSTCG